MKAKELIELLQGFNPEEDVVCYCEDENQTSKDFGFRLFDIIGIDTKDVERIRPDNIPYLKFGKTPSSIPQLLIEITSDF